jgi:hypothetical protein
MVKSTRPLAQITRLDASADRRSAVCRRHSHTFVSSSFVALSNSGRKPPLFVQLNLPDRGFGGRPWSDKPLYQIDAYALQEERLISDKPLFRFRDGDPFCQSEITATLALFLAGVY